VGQATLSGLFGEFKTSCHKFILQKSLTFTLGVCEVVANQQTPCPIVV